MIAMCYFGYWNQNFELHRMKRLEELSLTSVTESCWLMKRTAVTILLDLVEDDDSVLCLAIV